MNLNPKQIEAVLALAGPKRYEHFIKQVADREEVWGLYRDGWAMAGDDEGRKIFPLWPRSDYASLCVTGDWQGYEPSSFPLTDLMEELLPKLERDGVLPGIFYTPSDKGVIPSIPQLLADLREELKRYEG